MHVFVYVSAHACMYVYISLPLSIYIYIEREIQMGICFENWQVNEVPVRVLQNNKMFGWSCCSLLGKDFNCTEPPPLIFVC